MLAICNTVVVSSRDNQQNDVTTTLGNEEESSDPSETIVDGQTNRMYLNGRLEANKDLSGDDNRHEQTLTYEAESPDEAALVKSASMYGYKLISRGPDSITIEAPGEGTVKYHLLHVLVFDSIRKRMSVIVRRENDDRIIMYCKGADTAVIPRLSRGSKSMTLGTCRNADTLDGKASGETEDVSLVEMTETHLNVYAREGLRTLCMARKVSVIFIIDVVYLSITLLGVLTIQFVFTSIQ